jgi:hypothetical protein
LWFESAGGTAAGAAEVVSAQNQPMAMLRQKMGAGRIVYIAVGSSLMNLVDFGNTDGGSALRRQVWMR